MKLALFAVVLLLFVATAVITLLGITQRLKVERVYLNRLFSALILELVAAVLFLVTDADFFAEEPLPAADQARLAALDRIYPGLNADALLQQFTQATAADESLVVKNAQLQQAEGELRAAHEMLDGLRPQLAEQQEQIQLLRSELLVRAADTARLHRLERLFLVRMAELSGMLSEWGTSVNLLWKADEKRDIALLLQEAFKEIGFMNDLEIPNDDPLLAHDILLRYQQAKGFKELGFLTQQTIVLIIQDYLSRANSSRH